MEKELEKGVLEKEEKEQEKKLEKKEEEKEEKKQVRKGQSGGGWRRGEGARGARGQGVDNISPDVWPERTSLVMLMRCFCLIHTGDRMNSNCNIVR